MARGRPGSGAQMILRRSRRQFDPAPDIVTPHDLCRTVRLRYRDCRHGAGHGLSGHRRRRAGAHSVSVKKSRISGNRICGRALRHKRVGLGILAVGSQNECTAPPTIITCQSILASVSFRFRGHPSSASASPDPAEPWIASTRPLILQGVPGCTGFGLVTWNTTMALKSAPARPCSNAKPPPAQ